MTSACRTDRSDADLLAAHAAGDRRAFEELFRRHGAGLRTLARQQSVTEEDAADALQDAMLSVHRGAGEFRQDSAVSSWLHRIVVNACRDRRRRAAVRPTCPIDSDDSLPVSDRTGEVETTLVVREALLRLSTDQRVAVFAVDMQGYSVADAAVLLNIAEGTVKSRRARARARLAELLGCPSTVASGD